MRRLNIFWLGLLMLFGLNSWANYPDVPKPFRYVTDYTQTLNSQDKQTLENALVDYANKNQFSNCSRDYSHNQRRRYCKLYP